MKGSAVRQVVLELTPFYGRSASVGWYSVVSPLGGDEPAMSAWLAAQIPSGFLLSRLGKLFVERVAREQGDGLSLGHMFYRD